MARTTASTTVVASSAEILRNTLGGLSELSFLDRSGSVDILETASLKAAAAGGNFGTIEFLAEGMSGNALASAAQILLALEPFSANELSTPTAPLTKSSSGKRGRSVASEEDSRNAWDFIAQAKGIKGVSAEYEIEDGRIYFSATSSRLSYELRRKGVAGSTLVETALLLAKLLPYAKAP